MKIQFILVAILALWASPAQAQVTKVVGPNPVGTTSTNPPVVVAGKTAAGVITTTLVAADGSPKVSTNITAPAGAPGFTLACSTSSAAVTGLTGGTCYRMTCSAPIAFRTGTGTPTALTTDADFFGPATENLCLPAASTAVACVTASGTATCKGTAIP
jgi:hypothetical protein